MHSGIALLLENLKSRTPEATKFVDFSEFASGPALMKACIENPSFVNVSGEWGKKLKRFANEDRTDGPMSTLRTAMTNLYQKSGPQSVVGGISYSNKDKNIISPTGVAYSLIGESTPETYYESLTDSMMEDGFLSRFTMIEYNGGRVPLNYNRNTTIGSKLGDALSNLVGESTVICNGGSKSKEVQFDKDAAEIFTEFEIECDNEINSTEEEAWRQMWNRGSLKSMRIAALLAAADNPFEPVMNLNHALWRIDIIRRDIELMSRKLSTGEIGHSDYTRLNKVRAVCYDYLKGAGVGFKNIPAVMLKEGVVPYRYLMQRTSNVSCFRNHRGGATNALKSSIANMIDSGELHEVAPAAMITNYNYHGKAYRILSIGL